MGTNINCLRERERERERGRKGARERENSEQKKYCKPSLLFLIKAGKIYISINTLVYFFLC